MSSLAREETLSGLAHRPSVRIRSAGIEELEDVRRIENACFREERYSTEVLAAMLEEEGFETFLAEDDGELMGSATVNYRNDLVAAQLVSIAVLPRHRGKGVARELLAEAEARVRRRGAGRMVLQAAVTNVAALNLYLHQGYELQGVIGDYYGPGRDAYYMDKALEPLDPRICGANEPGP